jgi:beta-lactamase class A
VRNRRSIPILRGISIAILSIALVLTIISLIGYSRQRNNYPAGMTIGGVRVGGVDPQTALQRVLQVYSSPIELQYGSAVIQVEPSLVGFELNLDAMIAAADLGRTGGSFWGGFWSYLWNRDPTPVEIPLSATIAEDRLIAYLKNEVAARYDEPPTSAQPIPGSTSFTPGAPGKVLDIDRAVRLIEDTLRSPNNRTVVLSYGQSAAARPTIDNLSILLKQIVTTSGFDGVLGLYMLDLQTGSEIHFALNQGQEISIQPDVAFTASSTIKIPILVSYYIKNGTAPVDDQTQALIAEMIRKSDNNASDAMMNRIDPNTGPLIVSDNMKTIGLDSTFLAGFFAPGSPLLRQFATPSNSRTDVSTDPDSYNQTTPLDIGSLLADLYQCATAGGGALIAAFPDKITTEICQQIIASLSTDKIGVLIEAGIPEGTQIAHKHGWITSSDGVIRNFSDAGIVYSAGGNFVLAIYAYHPNQIVFDDANALFANLGDAVYNFYNLPTP